MAYNWDKTKPTGSQPVYDIDDAIRDTRAGVEGMLGTEHIVDTINPTAVTAKHALGSARAGYNTYANRPTSGSGVETGRLFVCSDSKKLMHGNGSAVEYTEVDQASNADAVDGAHAGTAANNVLKLDSSGLVPLGNIPPIPRSKISNTEQSLGSSGYVTLPGGLIIQWSTIHFSSRGSYQVTLPRAFPTAHVAGFVTPVNYTGNAPQYYNKTLSGMTLWVDSGGDYHYLAIGY